MRPAWFTPGDRVSTKRKGWSAVCPLGFGSLTLTVSRWQDSRVSRNGCWGRQWGKGPRKLLESDHEESGEGFERKYELELLGRTFTLL